MYILQHLLNFFLDLCACCKLFLYYRFAFTILVKKVYKHLEEIGYVFISGQFELFNGVYLTLVKEVH